MIRSQDMLKVTLYAHARDREQVLQHLHRLGIVQLIDLKTTDVALPNAVPSDELRDVSDLLVRVSRVNHVLGLAPEKQQWKQSLFGLETLNKARIARKDKAAVEKEATAFLAEYEAPLVALEEEHATLVENLQELKEARKVALVLEEHGLPVAALTGTERVRAVTGRVQTANLAKLEQELDKELGGAYHVHATEENNRESVVTALGLAEHGQQLTFLLKKYGVATMSPGILPETDDPLDWTEREAAATEKAVADVVKRIAKHRKAHDKSVFLREELELLKERFEAVHKLKESTSFFVLQGWVTRKEHDLLAEHVPEAVIETEAPTQEEEPPVRLSNPWFYRPFEMLTELYALPKYKDLDPTFVVAPLFIVYAGFMLTDFVYGLGLVVLGAAMYALFRKHQEGTKHMSVSIMGIGLFSMLFGVLTGSYLGDAPKLFWGIETAQLAIWKDPLADPLYFLIISLAVGLTHLNIGLVLGLVEDVRKRAWKTLLSDRVSWWLLQVTVLAYVLKWGTAAHVLLGLTVLLVLVLHGPLGLLGMTGFMGDVISYSRLFALALSTAGIAMTVNLLSGMLAGVPFVGLLLAGLVFLVGHLFSFLMNALGSFVHSIRLQFVEFFGKFYEGGGDKFVPFAEERVYTEVRE